MMLAQVCNSCRKHFILLQTSPLAQVCNSCQNILFYSKPPRWRKFVTRIENILFYSKPPRWREFVTRAETFYITPNLIKATTAHPIVKTPSVKDTTFQTGNLISLKHHIKRIK
jgi:hypothetical protein